MLGWVTYQGFAAAWPTKTDTGEFGERMNSLPKHVVTTTLPELEWNSTPIRENIAEEVSRLKQQPGQDILIFGSADVVNKLMQDNLIDEYRLMVYPVVVGKGKQLFNEGNAMQTMKLVDTRTFSSGVVVLTHHPAVKEAQT